MRNFRGVGAHRLLPLHGRHLLLQGFHLLLVRGHLLLAGLGLRRLPLLEQRQAFRFQLRLGHLFFFEGLQFRLLLLRLLQLLLLLSLHCRRLLLGFLQRLAFGIRLCLDRLRRFGLG